jgi:allophanate hydrolase subunit 2
VSLVVVKALGWVTIQDRGRPGHMHEGLAPGGALVPELLRMANRHAQNADDAAGVEVMGSLTVRAIGPVRVATDVEPARDLQVGDELTVAASARRVVYLAIRGGVGAPVILGSRSTQLSAGLGQILRAGDAITAGGAPEVTCAVEPSFDGSDIRVVPGPDTSAFGGDALEALTAGAYVVLPTSNRVGTRLDGARLRRTDTPDVTRPMVCGAIEVPRDGGPIVLGPEHPTTGGYPVIAVIVHDDLGRFFAVPAGSMVRFRIAPARDAPRQG